MSRAAGRLRMWNLSSLAGQMLAGMTDKKKRDEVIIKYAPLVKNIVERIALKLPSYVNKDDLINAGIIGLISALKKFDETRNVLFETYARFRIRGAVLDELRSRDGVSRSAKNKAAKIEEAFTALQGELRRHPTDEEVSDFLGVSVDEYYKLLNEARGVCILSTDNLCANYCEKYGTYDVLEKIDQNNPFFLLADKELKETLRDAIDLLSKKEKLVLQLYYYEELTLKEIGMVMSLSESRICQLHSQIILKLKSILKKYRHDEFI
ncbi:MAG: FliA/WhiG family RNA polymerase sigma factor [Deltaproteobacteria bacterium]|nr:MAG: FliA/WhiG family RNA polymerase sigma factor [Deltaproteobacteria bacterium]